MQEEVQYRLTSLVLELRLLHRELVDREEEDAVVAVQDPES